MTSSNFLVHADRDHAQHSAERKRAGVAHEHTRAGWQLNQRKPRPAPTRAAAEDGQLTRAADDGQEQISREFHVAADVAEDRVGERHG